MTRCVNRFHVLTGSPIGVGDDKRVERVLCFTGSPIGVGDDKVCGCYQINFDTICRSGVTGTGALNTGNGKEL